MTPAILLGLASALAADHAEAPGTQADIAADITDFYAWHTTGSLVAVVNFAGFGLPGDPAEYDPDVLYGVHIDRDGDHVADHDVWVRFGTDSLGAWGVQVVNLPGAGAPVVGPVESVITAPGGRVFAGLRDDPFFFDFEGLTTTLSTAAVSFDSTRDSFAGTNVTSIVLEMDLGAATDGETEIQVWATSSRI